MCGAKTRRSFEYKNLLSFSNCHRLTTGKVNAFDYMSDMELLLEIQLPPGGNLIQIVDQNAHHKLKRAWLHILVYTHTYTCVGKELNLLTKAIRTGRTYWERRTADAESRYVYYV